MMIVEEVPATDAETRVATWAEERAAGATYREIGDRHGISHERVRQVLKEAGVDVGPSNWATLHKKEAQAAKITMWLKANGPVPAGRVYEEFEITPGRLAELVSGHAVPKEYIMAGVSSQSMQSTTIEEAATHVTATWERVQAEEPGVTGLSVGLYDRYRITGDPSPAMITSRFGWRNVCALAGVPTAGTGRPQYTPKWSNQELLDWVRKYTEVQFERGERVTFDGFDRWRHTQDGAPSGALLRTRLRREGYESWAAMVAAANGS